MNPANEPLQPAPTLSPSPAGRRGEGARGVISTILVLLLAPAIAYCLTVFVFQSYQVDGSSMFPTLMNNDRLIVLKAPRTWARITGHAYIPDRGNIIIFTEDNLAELGSSQPKQLVKRVIGLPGDRVVVKNDVVTVYNHAHPQGFDPDTTLPYGTSTHIPTTTGNIDLTVPAGQVFVCGDNRPDSLDSRIFGTVPVSAIAGKLVLRVFPLSHAEKF